MSRWGLFNFILILALVGILIIATLVLLGPQINNCFGLCGCRNCPPPTATAR